MTHIHLQALLQFDLQGNGVYDPDPKYGPEYKYLFEENYLMQVQDKAGGCNYSYWQLTEKGHNTVSAAINAAINVRH